jgi:hypothetical protein
MPQHRTVPVVLSAGERKTLKKRARWAKTAQRDWLRAQIVLAAARGRASARIAAGLHVSVDTVRKWRGRFAARGLDGLKDLPRPGRPRRISALDQAAVVALACQLPAATGVPLARWSGPLSSPRRAVLLFTCGWMITTADEDAVRQIPAGVWEPGIAQDGTIEEDKDVAEITHLMTRAGNWPDGLRWIARRVKPSRRHLRNLTDYEKKTGWKYSITCTSIPDAGISGVPGSHHPQYIGVAHREHAVVETAGVRTAKAMGLRNLPRSPGKSTAAGSSPRTSPPASPPGPASPASATTRNCAKPTRARYATGSGTSPPASPSTPASGP